MLSYGIFAELVRFIQKLYRGWLTRGIYTRLFTPVLLLLLAAAGLHYELLIRNELRDVRQQIQVQSIYLARMLSPELLQKTRDHDSAGITTQLQQELQADQNLQELVWQYQRTRLSAVQPQPVSPQAPAWFVSILKFPATLEYRATMPKDPAATLEVTFNTAEAINRIWRKIVIQLAISGVLICLIYLLMGFVLRANVQSLRRLVEVTEQFKHGDYTVRLSASGTMEARALAQSFNDMAEEVQKLLSTLQQRQREQSEQLHFTWQVLTALPIPTFFSDQHGRCRGVNPAWCQMFDMPQKEAVGRPMRELLSSADINGDLTALTGQPEGVRGTEVQISRQGQTVVALYYQATYTSVDGEYAGTIGSLVDISERKKAQAALAEQKDRVETTLDSIGDGVISCDANGQILTLNRAARQLTGWHQHEAESRALHQIFALADAKQAAALRQFITQVPTQSGSYQASNLILLTRSGRQLDIDLTAAPTRQKDNAVRGCVLVFRDLSETRHLLRQISWQAGHDLLTGLPNRASLSDHFQQAMQAAQEKQQMLAVCLMDLDHFQAVNERYGQEFADKLLKQVAERLERYAGQDNPVARLGGDEFVVLLQNQSDTRQIQTSLSGLLTELGKPYEIDQRQTTMTASIGVAVYPQDEHSPDVLLRYADQAMYQAKISGRNKFHLFDAQKDEEVRTRHNQRARIREALLKDEFELYYQPKLNIREGRIIGMEALIRWNHPERGVVGPMEFLPLVEYSNLIIDIGNWVIHQALQQLSEWLARGHRWVLSVNIAARHFQHSDFLENLRADLARFPDVPPQYLEIEILESAAIQDIQHVREIMLACQNLGVRFALDDFGTGYSSLSYLKRLPADILKIDQSFVRDMLDDQDDLALIGAIVGLASAFRREVIAEGVESAEHGIALMHLGCDLLQGYGIARPMPVSQVESWVQHYVPPVLWQQRA